MPPGIPSGGWPLWVTPECGYSCIEQFVFVEETSSLSPLNVSLDAAPGLTELRSKPI